MISEFSGATSASPNVASEPREMKYESEDCWFVVTGRMTRVFPLVSMER